MKKLSQHLMALNTLKAQKIMPYTLQSKQIPTLLQFLWMTRYIQAIIFMT